MVSLTVLSIEFSVENYKYRWVEDSTAHGGTNRVLEGMVSKFSAKGGMEGAAYEVMRRMREERDRHVRHGYEVELR
jgi:hypothetical protein